MKGKMIGIMGIAALYLLLAACPGWAWKIYLVPSIQTSNHSPDHTYVEGDAMVDVAARTVSKLVNRGFAAKSSGYTFGSVNAACSDAAAWGANTCISNHTNASAANDTGWHSQHGTSTYYLVNWSGYSRPGDIDIATKCRDKCLWYFNAFGRAYNNGVIGVNQGDFVWNGPGDHALVEGLFHDNWDDLQVLNDSWGRESYSLAMFDAVCDHYGMAYRNYFYWTWKGSGQVTTNPGNALIEIFVKGADGQIYHSWQVAPNNAFVDWVTLGAPTGGTASDPVAVINQSGGNQVVVRGNDGNIWTIRQSGAGGAWGAWTNLGGGIAAGKPTVGRQVNGWLEIYTRMTDGSIWHKWETADGTWGPFWYNLLGSGGTASDPVVTLNTDGRQEIFWRGNDNKFYHTWQSANFSSWASAASVLNQTFASDPEVARVADGRLALFGRAADGSVWYDCQGSTLPGASWWGWANMGSAANGNVAAGDYTSGCMDMFTVQSDNAIWHRWQTQARGSWTTYWNSLGGNSTITPIVGHHDDGRTAIFTIRSDGYMYANWQTNAADPTAWTGWMQLGRRIF